MNEARDSPHVIEGPKNEKKKINSNIINNYIKIAIYN